MSAEEMKRKARTFVLIKAEPRKEKEIMEKLLKLDEVKEVHVIAGEMDLIAVLETRIEPVVGVLETVRIPSSKKVVEFIMNKILSIKGVQDTETMMPVFSKTKFLESV
jgi:DNA-binding Lrp family transcriptional regulator